MQREEQNQSAEKQTRGTPSGPRFQESDLFSIIDVSLYLAIKQKMFTEFLAPGFDDQQASPGPDAAYTPHAPRSTPYRTMPSDLSHFSALSCTDVTTISSTWTHWGC